ncbi:putative cytoplasmatic protein CoxI (plasmid) [Afipia carboxidovorans OM5]|uniref:Putative cytoplasmatic protein CoxI n=1 Tax=Afipia carboxidovorans (strain ATCC 49405 / DSM 1227 / KCTC 32145 / OM5) TaxID=504832 RepID=F8C102_AFIC5|nr:XdhC family protein [Afipia carboxidovorans]AEI04484.1 putative cytoplasmatic protein CoxI [Afipia carboxidovorans OM4]AEI08112.1 putative cytoplasmatic protein CoxI [Afipia carboxidovorans OM5]
MKTHDGNWEIFEDYVLDFALEQMRAGTRIAIVTLTRIEGSSPRPLGAQMVVSETEKWVGYLSGGCIERAVVAEALEAIREGKNRTVRYGRGSKYFDIQLPCGSAIELVFEVDRRLVELSNIDELLRSRRPASMTITVSHNDGGHDEFERCYYLPRRQLLIAGVGPSAVQLARLARVSGFDVQLYSPDKPTLQAAELYDVRITGVTSPTVLPPLCADSRTAFVSMFHDHNWELSFLPEILKTEAFYIGALGSRATHRQRLVQLSRLGIDEMQLKRIHGPAGLYFGGKSASDVALSILSEISQLEQDEQQRALRAFTTDNVHLIQALAGSPSVNGVV